MKDYFHQLNQLRNEIITEIVNQVEEFPFSTIDLIMEVELNNNTKTKIISITEDDDDDIVFLLDKNNEIIHLDMLEIYSLVFVYEKITDKIDSFTNKIKEETEKVKNHNPLVENRMYYLPLSYFNETLSGAEFSSLALQYGKVMSMTNFVREFNKIGEISPSVGKIKYLPFSTTFVECCPHCENEVVLETKFEKQICPICGKKILPCSLCYRCQDICPLADKK